LWDGRWLIDNLATQDLAYRCGDSGLIKLDRSRCTDVGQRPDCIVLDQEIADNHLGAHDPQRFCATIVPMDQGSNGKLLVKKTLDRVAACFTGGSRYQYEICAHDFLPLSGCMDGEMTVILCGTPVHFADMCKCT
jgi:hypothetical protein